MEPWYFLNLGDATLAADPMAEVKDVFLQAFQAAGSPPDMAVFTRHESEGRLHCEVIAYFSPAAHAVAETLEARPCLKPARSELGLLAGNKAAWQILFFENET